MTFKLEDGRLGFKLGEVLVGLKSGTEDVPQALKMDDGAAHMIPYARNPDTLAFEVMTQPLTDDQLRATNVLVTATQGTSPWISGLNAYRSSDSTYQPLRLDSATNSLQTIDYGHHEVHAGSSYYYHDIIALANNAVQDYVITVPDTTTWPHIGFEIDFNDGAGTIEFYEGTDKNGTTLQTSLNRDRNSLNAATTTIHKNQSGGTTDGTRIIWGRAGSGKNMGGTSATADERVLKRNTKYILRITNVAGASVTNNITVIMRWYEHANIA